MATESGGKFQLKSQTQAEEDAYDLAQHVPQKSNGNIGTIAHFVKGSLGAGLLAGHEAFQKGGLVPACILQVLGGIYMTYCVNVLVRSTHIIYKRLHTYNMSYSDVGEAALAMCPNKRLARFSKAYRYLIDVLVCIDLYGSCVVYQLIIAKTIKQLVEDDVHSDVEGIPGYPNLRVYLVIMLIPCVLICLITNLKYLAPFSVMANCVIVEDNPSFEGMKQYGDFVDIFRFMAMTVFSMSFAGIVIPVCNEMKNPQKYGRGITCGMIVIVLFLFTISFFGMNAYRENSTTPITLNFPMALFPKILKAMIAFMIYVTHSLNFYTPFRLCWHYLRKLHSKHFDNPAKMVKLEMIYRALICCMISLVAILFPTCSAVMGLTGSLCLSNMAFIWPNLIEIFVIWSRPGFGRFKWRLWKSVVLICIGMVLLTIGTVVNLEALFASLKF